MRDSHSAAEMKGLEARMLELGALMEQVKEAKEGRRIALDKPVQSDLKAALPGAA